MTVTREPVDGVDPAATDQARADARRAAQAVRLARRSRAGATSLVKPAPAVPEPVADDARAVEDDTDARAATSVDPADAAVAEADRPDSAEVPDTSTDTSDDASENDEGSEESGDATDRIRRRPRRVTVLAGVAAVLALAFAVVALVVRVQAGDPAGTSPAAARDAALLAARQDIVVLNTLDYTDVNGGLQRWLGATTGTLRDQLSQVSDADKQAIAVSKSRTTASVLAAAVTQVDAPKGAATVIASVQIAVTPEGGQATQKRTRFSLTMQRVGDVWKIGAVQQVGVTLT